MKGCRNSDGIPNIEKQQDYFFSLKPIQKIVSSRFDVVVDFSPVESTNKNQKILCNVYPQANFDGKSHLPTFILECDKNYYQTNQQEYQQLHQNKKFNSNIRQNQLIYVPKPSTSCLYCNVCKVPYDDYIDHINQFNHKKKLAKNPYSRHITKLCSNYQKSKSKILKQADSASRNSYIQSRNKNISLSNQTSCDDELIELSRPKKKLHLDNFLSTGKGEIEPGNISTTVSGNNDHQAQKVSFGFFCELL